MTAAVSIVCLHLGIMYRAADNQTLHVTCSRRSFEALQYAIDETRAVVKCILPFTKRVCGLHHGMHDGQIRTKMQRSQPDVCTRMHPQTEGRKTVFRRDGDEQCTRGSLWADDGRVAVLW